MNNFSDSMRALKHRLRQVENKELRAELAFGIQYVLAGTAAVFFFFILLESLFHFESSVRSVLFYTWAASIGALGVQFLVFPLLRRVRLMKDPNHYETASRIGALIPSLRDDLLNALQLITISDDRVSRRLAEAAFAGIMERIEEIDFRSYIRFHKAVRFLRISAPIFFLVLILHQAVPALQEASFRFFNYELNFVPPARFHIEVTPGNTVITKGEDVTVTVKVNGEPVQSVILYHKDDTQTSFAKQIIKIDSTGTFSYMFFGIRNPVTYYAAAEEVESEAFRIDVIERPMLERFALRVVPPAYSGETAWEQEDNGSISGLVGTAVYIELAASKPLREAYLQFGDSVRIPLAIEDDRAAGSFRLAKDIGYWIVLIDEDGNQNLSPIEYSVTVRYDGSPAIQMIAPGKNIDLGEDRRVSLLASASDDFGISKLLLRYRLSASKYEEPWSAFQTIEIPVPANSKEVNASYFWNLASLDLGTEDVVTYYLEVFDNDAVSGPKSARTPEFTLRVPSLQETLTTLDDTQEELVAEMEEVVKDAAQLQEKMKEVEQALKKDEKKITWEEKTNIEQVLNEFEQLQNKVDEMQQKFEETKEELQKNNLLSEETMKKYLEMQELFKELSNEDMKKAMEQMEQMLQNMDRNQVRENMENMTMNEELFQKSIERTMNLLKRMQIEQQTDALKKETEQLAKEQNELGEKTENSDLNNQQEKDALEKRQKEITEQLKDIAKKMDDLQKKMEGMEDMPSEKMQELSEEFQKQQNDQLSEQAQQQMQQQQKQKALQNQQQVSKNMEQMQQMISQMQQQMQQQNQMQTFADMMKLMNGIVQLSKEQEALKQETKQNPQSSELKDEMRRQDELQNKLSGLMNQMQDLSQKTFAMTPEMGKALGDALQKMQTAMQEMENRNNQNAATTQSSAMESLNGAALMMKNSLDAMMQGGSPGSGMPSLMQQLAQLSGQQMSLNNLTQQMQQGQQGQLTPQQQGELGRLAQQQELIRKSLEQLNKEAELSGEKKKIPANLQDIMDQMQEVITNMETGKLDDPMVQQQERILSRLLDAQRSINERDFDKERESYTGTNVEAESPDGLSNSPRRILEGLKDALQRAAQEGYAPDYEDVIRRYYDSLRDAQN